MKKLSRSLHERLRSEYVGKALTSDSAAERVANKAIDEAWAALNSAWATKSEPLVRQEVSALIDLAKAIPWDGFAIGVAVNKPSLFVAATSAAKSLGITGLAKLLTKASAILPPRFEKKSSDARLDWIDGSPQGQKASKQFEKIESAYENGEFFKQILPAVIDHMLANPTDFFKTR